MIMNGVHIFKSSAVFGGGGGGPYTVLYMSRLSPHQFLQHTLFCKQRIRQVATDLPYSQVRVVQSKVLLLEPYFKVICKSVREYHGKHKAPQIILIYCIYEMALGVCTANAYPKNL